MEPFYRRIFGKISRHFGDLRFAESYQMEDAEYLIIAYGCTAAVDPGRGADRARHGDERRSFEA